jgi:hypothetical protein
MCRVGLSLSVHYVAVLAKERRRFAPGSAVEQVPVTFASP